MIGNYGRAAGERVFLRWATLGERRQPRTWPRLEMGKVLTAVSSTGQKPKSRVSGTTAAADGTCARIGMQKVPVGTGRLLSSGLCPGGGRRWSGHVSPRCQLSAAVCSGRAHTPLVRELHRVVIRLEVHGTESDDERVREAGKQEDLLGKRH